MYPIVSRGRTCGRRGGGCSDKSRPRHLLSKVSRGDRIKEVMHLGEGVERVFGAVEDHGGRRSPEGEDRWEVRAARVMGRRPSRCAYNIYPGGSRASVVMNPTAIAADPVVKAAEEDGLASRPPRAWRSRRAWGRRRDGAGRTSRAQEPRQRTRRARWSRALMRLFSSDIFMLASELCCIASRPPRRSSPGRSRLRGTRGETSATRT